MRPHSSSRVVPWSRGRVVVWSRGCVVPWVRGRVIAIVASSLRSAASQHPAATTRVSASDEFTPLGWIPTTASLRTVSGLEHPHVELGMYPFASIEWAWDELWAAVHQRATWTPPSLTRSGDVHARWYDTDCVVTQVCGWPFAVLHHRDMHLVGSFNLDLPESAGDGHYRSVLLTPHDTTIDALVASKARAVANSADSLSGWISLLAATVGETGTWPGEFTFTSAHSDSVRALAKGEADIASIDSLTLSFLAAEEPDLLDGLHRLALGPRIPTPAITARASVGDIELDELRRAFRSAVEDPVNRVATDALHITGMSANTLDDYLATRALAPPSAG